MRRRFEVILGLRHDEALPPRVERITEDETEQGRREKETLRRAASEQRREMARIKWMMALADDASGPSQKREQ